jgi:hypothetical protein
MCCYEPDTLVLERSFNEARSLILLIALVGDVFPEVGDVVRDAQFASTAECASMASFEATVIEWMNALMEQHLPVKYEVVVHEASVGVGSRLRQLMWPMLLSWLRCRLLTTIPCLLLTFLRPLIWPMRS